MVFKNIKVKNFLIVPILEHLAFCTAPQAASSKH